MATELDVGGYTSGKVLEGQPVTVNTATVRLRSSGQLDIESTGDGGKTVLEYIQEAASLLASASPPVEPPAEWTELLRIPSSGTKLTISFGVRSEFKENV